MSAIIALTLAAGCGFFLPLAGGPQTRTHVPSITMHHIEGESHPDFATTATKKDIDVSIAAAEVGSMLEDAATAEAAAAAAEAAVAAQEAEAQRAAADAARAAEQQAYAEMEAAKRVLEAEEAREKAAAARAQAEAKAAAARAEAEKKRKKEAAIAAKKAAAEALEKQKRFAQEATTTGLAAGVVAGAKFGDLLAPLVADAAGALGKGLLSTVETVGKKGAKSVAERQAKAEEFQKLVDEENDRKRKLAPAEVLAITAGLATAAAVEPVAATTTVGRRQ